MERGYFTGIGLTLIMTLCNFGCGIDIHDEQNVIHDIQGSWIGYEKISGTFRHIKLIFTENTFDSWLQISDSENEPSWTILPSESGTFSLSSVLENSTSTRKYRTIRFSNFGSCCGDNSATSWTLSKLITYDEGGGLTISHSILLARK